MNYRIIHLSIIATVVILFGPGFYMIDNSVTDENELVIAFMPDVHFHDVFADHDDTLAERLPIIKDGEKKRAFIRTMEAQLTSTRLFNENYFAFIAALDDAVDRGIKLIALPGDFSDDGQPVHIKGLVKLLNKYRDEHDIQFFISPGNHDPGRPFMTEAGKQNFLGKVGRPQPIFSKNHRLCTETTRQNRQISGTPVPHDVICSDEVKMLGYEGLFNLLADFGLKPNESTIFFETPFDNFSETASVEESEGRFGFSDRQYEICHEGTGGIYRQSYYTNCFNVMDMSYLIEPAEGLWLLSIDANVYIPAENADTTLADNPANFSGSGNAGYNRVITHKQHLLDWIADVSKRAEEKGKHLIAFSHFPAADFYNQADQKIEEIWGEGRFQLNRMPEKSTSKILASTGLSLHVGGHMHMNDTSVAQDPETGSFLFNIQVPSLAAYIPAYKIVRFTDSAGLIEVETIILDEVPHFDTFFQNYQDEWDYLDSIGYERIWNREILNSSSYREFTDWHIRELSRLRFLPREWPEKIRDFLSEFNGCDMLAFSQLNFTEISTGLREESIDLTQLQTDYPDLWDEAQRKAEMITKEAGFTYSDLCQWNGKDLGVDFYRLRNADELAIRDIPASRLEQYSLVAGILAKNVSQVRGENADLERLDILFNELFSGVFKVMHRFSFGLPANHFMIDLANGEIIDLTEEINRFIY